VNFSTHTKWWGKGGRPSHLGAVRVGEPARSSPPPRDETALTRRGEAVLTHDAKHRTESRHLALRSQSLTVSIMLRAPASQWRVHGVQEQGYSTHTIQPQCGREDAFPRRLPLLFGIASRSCRLQSEVRAPHLKSRLLPQIRLPLAASPPPPPARRPPHPLSSPPPPAQAQQDRTSGATA